LRVSVRAAHVQVETASVVPKEIRQPQATVEQRKQQVSPAKAQLQQAQLNLSYCAPSTDQVRKR
jgi:membrane fusion protein (multidrug efflux system)